MRLLVLITCFVGIVLAAPLVAQSPLAPELTTFPLFSVEKGEDLHYNVKFLWLEKFGKGRLTFVPGPEPGTYRATAYARTRGVAALVSQHLTQTYEVLMRQLPDGSLQPLQTRSIQIRGKKGHKKRESRYTFDYDNRTVTYRKIKNGQEYGHITVDMPPEKPVYDLLSAFYNWRLGVFGQLKRPSHFKLPTITKRGESDILVGVRTREDQNGRSLFPETGMLARVVVDKEVFHTDAGSMFVWVNEEAQPGIVVVEEVLGLGNITATLTSP